MTAVGLLHPLLVVGWIIGSHPRLDLVPPHGFPVLLLLHLLVALLIFALGRGECDSRTRRRWLWVLPLLLLPPSAPVVICLLASGVAWRAAGRWRGHNEAARGDLRHLAEAWRRMGVFGVVMGTMWCWGYLETLLDPQLAGWPHPWLDPLEDFTQDPSIAARAMLVLATLAYARLLVLTLRALRLHQGLWAGIGRSAE